jgi:hypothetical protein
LLDQFNQQFGRGEEPRNPPSIERDGRGWIPENQAALAAHVPKCSTNVVNLEARVVGPSVFRDQSVDVRLSRQRGNQFEDDLVSSFPTDKAYLCLLLPIIEGVGE